MGIFSDSKGKRCEVQEDGSIRCRIFKVKGTDKLGTGSDFTLVQDKVTCKTTVSGQFDILEEDREEVEATIKQVESACKGGL